MNRELEREYENQDLEKQRKEVLNQIEMCNAKLYQLKTQYDCLTKRIQQNCNHEWITDIQIYEKDGYCKRCKLTDWENSRF